MAIHAITSPADEPILLCDKHFQEVSSAGLVKDHNIGKKEFDRREKAKEVLYGGPCDGMIVTRTKNDIMYAGRYGGKVINIYKRKNGKLCFVKTEAVK
jgi:hypothetical protein